MKKVFLVFSVAALALMACTSESVEYVGSGPEAKEIAFSPLAQRITRAAVDGTTFPTSSAMQVAAYDVTHTREFFGATPFSYRSSNIWAGGKYWPLSAAYINFLAYTNFNGTFGSETDGATWGSPNASGVTLVMTDNKTAQKDLMYAIGNGAVTQSGNDLNFPANVPMEFKHAQAWISFKAKGDASITINSITLNGAKYAGTYTITHTNYNKSSLQSVSGAWSSLGSVQNVAVPNSSLTLSGSSTSVGDGLMIVPDDAATGDFTSFTINYTHDSKTYDYTFTPANTNVEQGKHYIYDITFTLHEILIAATVTDWEDQTYNYVDIPGKAFTYSENNVAGTFNVTNIAGTYTATITGCAASTTYTVSEETSDDDWISEVTSVTSDSNGNLTFSFTVTANGTGIARSKNLVFTNSTLSTKITVTQAL